VKSSEPPAPKSNAGEPAAPKPKLKSAMSLTSKAEPALDAPKSGAVVTKTLGSTLKKDPAKAAMGATGSIAVSAVAASAPPPAASKPAVTMSAPTKDEDEEDPGDEMNGDDEPVSPVEVRRTVTPSS
jgi:hypothetical protein